MPSARIASARPGAPTTPTTPPRKGAEMLNADPKRSAAKKTVKESAVSARATLSEAMGLLVPGLSQDLEGAARLARKATRALEAALEAQAILNPSPAEPSPAAAKPAKKK